MQLLLLALSWWVVGFTGAMMPGPVTTLIVTTSARRGFIAGPLITLGHVGLELLMVIALSFGLADLLKQNAVAGAIGIVGGLVLLWMGWDIVTSAWQGKVSLTTSPRMQTEPATLPQGSGRPPNPAPSPSQAAILARPIGNPILAGVLTSITNPYWLLWWATVGAVWLVTFRDFGLAGIIAFYVGHTLADWVWNNVVAFVVATGRRVMTDQVYRAVLIVCGGFLLILSIYFIRSGFDFLL
jgi:threonine/homoserine/homoserine lactone efflux protein